MLAGSCAIGGVFRGALCRHLETMRHDLVEDWAQEKTGGDDEADTGFYLTPDET